MKNVTYPIVMCILTSMTLPAAAYELSCISDYSGQSEVVDVVEADTFEKACKVVKTDLSYAEYSNCKDAEGNKKGKCP